MQNKYFWTIENTQENMRKKVMSIWGYTFKAKTLQDI